VLVVVACAIGFARVAIEKAGPDDGGDGLDAAGRQTCDLVYNSALKAGTPQSRAALAEQAAVAVDGSRVPGLPEAVAGLEEDLSRDDEWGERYRNVNRVCTDAGWKPPS
jgi:hypothetical protein